jgi:hypothetical protein
MNALREGREGFNRKDRKDRRVGADVKIAQHFSAGEKAY